MTTAEEPGFWKAYARMLRGYHRGPPAQVEVDDALKILRHVSLHAVLWGMDQAVAEAAAQDGKDFPPSMFKVLHWAQKAPALPPAAIDPSRQLSGRRDVPDDERIEENKRRVAEILAGLGGR